MLFGAVIGLISALERDLPEIRALEDYKPTAATTILFRDGEVLAEIFQERRRPLPLPELPSDLKLAIVAVEDRRFYKHMGLDLIRNFGALINDLKAWSLEEGASTITQQLARNLFLTRQKTLIRKLKEVYLAVQIERRYTKNQILEMYLNQIYFGSGAYGAAAASEIYFGKDVWRLTLEECALLAGLPQSPKWNNPFTHPQQALARREIVLKAMVREGFLREDRARAAASAPLNLRPRPEPHSPARYFVEKVRERLLKMYSPDEVYKGGLEVRTTLDAKLQACAERAVRDGLAAVNRALDREVQPEVAPYTPEKVQGALAAVEVGSGGVRAWVGGADFGQSRFDRVSQARRQPGSSFKPLIYARALEMGLSQADIIWDAPVSYPQPDGEEDWTPRNFSRRFEGEITLRRALEISGNIPAVKLLGKIGIDNFINAASTMGVTSPLARNLTLALGASEVSLIELLSSYQAMANGGLWIEPHFISEVRDRNGRIIYNAAPARRPVLSPEAAFIITDMLEGVVGDGTAQRASSLGRAVAGKTGTTDDYRDASFYGYSPELAAGVWVGFDSGRPLGPDWTGARSALPIWVEFMEEALEEKPILEFTPPAGIVMAYMNRFTGKGCDPREAGCVKAAFRPENRPSPAIR